MTGLTAKSQEYIQLFKKLQSTIEANSMEQLNAHRSEAMMRFEELGGFPTTRVEDYKYTDIDKVFDYAYDIATADICYNTPLSGEYKAPLKESYKINLRNGFLENYDSVLELEKLGVIICSLTEAARKHTVLFEKYYNKKTVKSEHSIAALNTAFVGDGLFIYIPENIHIEKPFQIINFLSSRDNLLVNTRHLLVIEKHAKAQFLDCSHALNCKDFLTNSVVELFAEDNANVAYYALQNQFEKTTILTNLFISQKRDSEVISNLLSLHGKQIRNNITVDLEEENCHNYTYGTYLTSGKGRVDNFSVINHIAPRCSSREHFKGILDNQAITGFYGKIHVFKDAQKTEAFQTNNNLVVSNEAKANTKPQLIIEADDVKCSHGATVGQLDEDAIYYLRARGISYKKAYRMMMYAFMSEITDKINIPELHQLVGKWISQKMSGEIIYSDFSERES